MTSAYPATAHPIYTRDGKDGFPPEPEFEAIMEEYLSALNPRKREKALMTQAMYDNILTILANPNHGTRDSTAQFRFWTKKMFRLVTTAQAHVVTHENRPVAVKEQIYDVLVQCHAQCSHGGRDKTSNQVRRYYSWIPKELIARFVKACPACQGRKNSKGGGGASNASGAFGMGASSPVSEYNSNSRVTTPARPSMLERPASVTSAPRSPSHLPQLPSPAYPYPQNMAQLPTNSPSKGIPDWSDWLQSTPQRPVYPHQRPMPSLQQYHQSLHQKQAELSMSQGSSQASLDSSQPPSAPVEGNFMTPRTLELVNSWCSQSQAPASGYGGSPFRPSYTGIPAMPDSSLLPPAPAMDRRLSVDSTELDFDGSERPSSVYSKCDTPELITPANVGYDNAEATAEYFRDLNGSQGNLESLDSLAGLAMNQKEDRPSNGAYYQVEENSGANLNGSQQIHNVHFEWSLQEPITVEQAEHVVQPMSQAQLIDEHQEVYANYHQQTGEYPTVQDCQVSKEESPVRHRTKPAALNLGQFSNTYIPDSSTNYLQDFLNSYSGAQTAPANVTTFLQPALPVDNSWNSVSGEGLEVQYASDTTVYDCNIRPHTSAHPAAYQQQQQQQEPYLRPPSAPASSNVAPQIHSAPAPQQTFFAPPLSLIPGIHSPSFFHTSMTEKQQQQAASHDLANSIQLLLENTVPTASAALQESPRRPASAMDRMYTQAFERLPVRFQEE